MDPKLTSRLGRLGGLLVVLASAGAMASDRPAPSVGSVAAHAGDAAAVGSHGERALGCGDVVHLHERLRTGADGRLTLVLRGDVLRVDPVSDVELAGTPEVLEVFVHRGRTRVLPSVAGIAGRSAGIGTPHLRIRATGADLELVVRPEHRQSVACVLHGSARIELPDGSQALDLPAGECARAIEGEVLVRRPRTPEPMASAATVCTELASRDLFEPSDVAAGLRVASLGPPGVGGGDPIQPCDTGLCQQLPDTRIPTPPGGVLPVVESPATPFDPGLLPGAEPLPAVESPATPFDPELLFGQALR